MEKLHKKYLTLSFLFAVLFVFVIFLIKHWYFYFIDNQFALIFENIRTNFGMQLMKGISFLASCIFVGIISILVLLFLFYKKKHDFAIFYAGTLGFGMFCSFVVKELVRRERPINLIETGFSFPSNHVVASVLMSLCLAYFLLHKKYKLIYLILLFPILVGISRMYLNVHWFSDVVGGFLLGLSAFFFGIFVFDKHRLKRMS